MAHFAKLDANNIVEQVIVVANSDTADSSGAETEAIGVAICQKLVGAGTPAYTLPIMSNLEP